MDEHGELKILEAPKENKKELMVLDDNANAGLIQAIEKDYMDLNEDGNEYVMSLVAKNFLSAGFYDGERCGYRERSGELQFLP